MCCGCCRSAAKSRPTLCDPMGCSTPGFPVHHHLPEPAQTHVHWVVMPSNHLILCRPLLLLPSTFPSIMSFPMSQLFASGGQSTGSSASVLPMNIQDWFPLGLTGLIFLQSKGLESSSTPQFKSINSSVLSFPCGPTLTSVHDYWKNHSFDYLDLCWQSNVSPF